MHGQRRKERQCAAYDDMMKETMVRAGDVPLVQGHESVSGCAWHRRASSMEDEKRLSQHYGMSAVMARLLVSRGYGISDETDALWHGDGSWEDGVAWLDSMAYERFSLLPLVAQRCVEALSKGEKIGLFTDYDVDGACSAAILDHYLRRFCAHGIVRAVPERVREGFGPNAQRIEALRASGVRLLFVCDCGSADKAFWSPYTQDMDIIIFDHHRMHEDWGDGEDGCWVVNPHKREGTEPSSLAYRHACATVLCFMFVVVLSRLQRTIGQHASIGRMGRVVPSTRDMVGYTGFVALAIICDVVSMDRHHHRLVRLGLRVLNSACCGDITPPHETRPSLWGELYAGLCHLIRCARVGLPVDEETCAYVIGPCLNAGSRLGESRRALDMLVEGRASDAERLYHVNKRRKAMQAQWSARFMTEKKDNDCVLWDKACPIGILGLLASMRVSRFHRPSFVFGQREDGVWVGSCRSVRGVNVEAWLCEAVATGTLWRGGGHAMAGGMCARDEAQLRLFAHFIEEKWDRMAGVLAKPVLWVDGVMGGLVARHDRKKGHKKSETARIPVDFTLWDDMARLRPWGVDYPVPCFMFSSMTIESIRFFGDGQAHGACRLRSSMSLGHGEIEAVAFHCWQSGLGAFLKRYEGRAARFAGHVRCEMVAGMRRLRLHLVDAAPIESVQNR
ncbi:MAG: DHH family phosphoesterase [Alphaproteobacteria bacterium GM7ARS4]|nr:DHH family phosphoesterase [Alphaproteobacteria bacterium GM7ARS4]